MGRPLTIGTAGHIDHGKTALVRALTGHDTDRLAEEKRRGISIDLGFAPLDLAEGRFSLVDVPGHERFVRTMIAGASGIDLFLMVVAANDGVMPQTREHLTVLHALGVEQGVVALTKCDVAVDAARARAREQAHALIPAAPLVEVSSETGDGITELRNALGVVAKSVRQQDQAPDGSEDAVLHVDRVFTIAGRGTVVTGTLWSGSMRRGDRVVLLPRGIHARAREVQVHDRQQESAEPHQRVALNLAGVRRDDVRRGDVVVSVGSALAPTYRLDVAITVRADDLADRERVQIHHGARQAPARVVSLGDDFAQLRLEAPLIAGDGDRFVLRRIAPPSTLGGGLILDAHPRRHGADREVERLRLIHEGKLDPSERSDATQPAKSAPVDAVSESRYEAAKPAEPDRLGLQVLALLRRDASMPRGPEALADALDVDPTDIAGALENLVLVGEVVRVKPAIYYPVAELEGLCTKIVALIRSKGSITVAELRDALAISRKYSQALLDYLDANRITLRIDDKRVLRGSGQHQE